MTAAKARLPPFLVQGHALRIARFGEDAHAETVDFSRGVLDIVVDYRKANRSGADVETKDQGHATLPLYQTYRFVPCILLRER
ncbi:MAG: hypothetical protein OXI75_07405 [Rhodospirillales bacterium]|nr:hypothetical protein [Rhodospirillales bacterium]